MPHCPFCVGGNIFLGSCTCVSSSGVTFRNCYRARLSKGLWSKGSLENHSLHEAYADSAGDSHLWPRHLTWLWWQSRMVNAKTWANRNRIGGLALPIIPCTFGSIITMVGTEKEACNRPIGKCESWQDSTAARLLCKIYSRCIRFTAQGRLVSDQLSMLDILW